MYFADSSKSSQLRSISTHFDGDGGGVNLEQSNSGFYSRPRSRLSSNAFNSQCNCACFRSVVARGLSRLIGAQEASASTPAKEGVRVPS